ncbi:MAG: hypothetical protein KGL39_27220 [Patescibacteria group bacterium]|nr:hypothetical protein [Patescibacteria group bacterium]
MAKKRALTIEQTGDQSIKPVPATIEKDTRDSLGDLLGQMVEYAIAARDELELNLDYWDAMYEMRVEEKDWPWQDCSNFVVPFIPAQLDSLAARLTGVVFQPRFFVVNGNTQNAINVQHKVERYYNAELSRHNWTEVFYQWLHLALRDGTAIMEILWRRENKTMPVEYEEDVTDDLTGEPTGEKRKVRKDLKLSVYDDVELTPVELRDFLLLPSWQTDLQARSAGAARMKLMGEDELLAMCKTKDNPNGVLWLDAVQAELETMNAGESDIMQSLQSTRDYTANFQIDITEDAGNEVPEYPRQRGPMRVWRIHTDALDLDGDGIAEENVFWVREQSRKLLGYCPYPYMHMKRPFVALTPIPRPGRFYGKSVCELLRTVQEELNAQHNQRNDQISLRLSPPFYRTRTADVRDQDHRTGPDSEWIVDKKDDVGIIELPDVPMSTWQEESLLGNYGQMVIGQSNPTMGMQSSSRRTAKEVQTQSAGANVRLDLMAARIREAAKEVFWQIHHLKLQYGPDEQQFGTQQNGIGERLTLTKSEMAMDFDLGITGMGGPLDKQGRQQEMMLVYSMLTQNPIVANNPMHLYAVTRMVLEAIGVSDIQSLIGTPEELQKMVQQQQQMQQQQMQLQQGDVQAQAEQRHARAQADMAKAQQAMSHAHADQQAKAAAAQQKQQLGYAAAHQKMHHAEQAQQTRQVMQLIGMMQRMKAQEAQANAQQSNAG